MVSMHNYKTSCVDILVDLWCGLPADLKESYDNMQKAREDAQVANLEYQCAASKCDREGKARLHKAIKNRMIDNLFKEINGSLKKLLALPEDTEKPA